MLNVVQNIVYKSQQKRNQNTWSESRLGVERCCVSWGCKIYPGQNINLTTLVRPARNSWCWCDVAKFTQTPRLTFLRQIYITIYKTSVELHHEDFIINIIIYSVCLILMLFYIILFDIKSNTHSKIPIK